MDKTSTETILYGGRVTVRFAEVSHIYTVSVDGGKYVRKGSVTGISGVKDKSEFLIPWALEEGAKHLLMLLEAGQRINEQSVVEAVYKSQEKKESAGDLGSKIHAWVEQHIRFKLKEKGITDPQMPEDDNVAIGVTSFLEWESQHKVEYLWAEKTIYSLKRDYVGRADFAAIVDGKRCLCDLKSSNGLYNAVRIQTALYAAADTEESGVKYDGRWAIRVAKETQEEYEERMALKNRIKAILGKPVKAIYPYQVFEAYYLDHNGTEMATDLEASVNAQGLNNWDKQTKFQSELSIGEKPAGLSI